MTAKTTIEQPEKILNIIRQFSDPSFVLAPKKSQKDGKAQTREANKHRPSYSYRVLTTRPLLEEKRECNRKRRQKGSYPLEKEKKP